MRRITCASLGFFVCGAMMVYCVITATAYAQTADAAPAFQAGFARVDITPPVGSEIPGGFAKNISKGVHDPLYAEAAVFVNPDTALALVGVDAVMIPRAVIEDARRQAEQGCGVPGANIMIAASHTHNGGPICDCFGSESDPEYSRLLAVRIAEAVIQARQTAVPAKLGVGVGHEDTVAFNRRFKMKDGTVKTHPGKVNPDIVEPAGPIDPDVGVIAIQDLQGEPLGCVVNYALHGTTMGGSAFSADWICYLRQTIRGGWGKDVGVVFLNGPCGDVTQVDNRNPRPAEFGEAWSRRVGMTVGAEALKVLARTEFSEAAPLAVTAEQLDLPIRDLAESDEALVAREAPATGLGSGGQEVYLREARLLREIKAAHPTVPVEVQAMRVGSAVLAANSTEYFCALGLSIKKASPVQPAMVVELANGYDGYSPTQEAFQGGGYEVRTARSSFLEPGSGEKIAEASIRVLNRLPK